MKFNIRVVTVVALLAFSAGALFIAACGNDDDNDAAAQVEQTQFDALKKQVSKTSMLAALTVFQVDRMHGLDDEISMATAIDDTWEGRVTRMHRALASVDEWPPDIQAKADLAMEKLMVLENALADGKLDDAKTYAPEAHDAWHDLEHEANPYIAGEEHMGPSDSGQAEGENSPSATMAGH